MSPDIVVVIAFLPLYPMPDKLPLFLVRCMRFCLIIDFEQRYSIPRMVSIMLLLKTPDAAIRVVAKIIIKTPTEHKLKAAQGTEKEKLIGKSCEEAK